VSRQLWWGHRIPAWYCPDGHITVSATEGGPSACEVCGRPAAELQQEPDIFDTWFSSGLWPFSTLGWPDQTPDLETYYPTSVMETGRTFANKLGNATRFVLGARPASIPEGAARVAPDEAHLGLAERWIRSRTAATIEAADRGIAEYQLAELTRALYDGIWSDFY